MKRIMKSIALLMIAVTIAASAPFAAIAVPEPTGLAKDSAETSMDSADKSMEIALIAVKNMIDVDDEIFTDFNYSSSYSNYETREGLVWQFQWSDQKSAYINAMATADGTLLSYNKYNYEGKRFGFAQIGKDAAVTIAEKFIKATNPDIYTYFKKPSEANTNLHSSDYNISFYAEINGYAFKMSQISISVNKFSGEVTGYYTRNISPGGFTFENAAGLIDQSAAVSAYAKKIGLNLEYRSNLDYEKGSITVFPVYTFSSNGDRYISAKTGDIVEFVYDRGSSDGASNDSGSSSASSPEAAQDSASGGGSKRLSPAEKSAIDQIAGFITSEQALVKLLEAAELTDINISAFNDQYIGLNRDYFDKDRYFYDVNMYRYSDFNTADDEVTGIYGRVDAATGRVISFSFYYNGLPYVSENKKWTDEQAQAAVETFLKKLAPAEYAKTKLETLQPPKVEPYGYISGYYYFNYVRYENDIPFRDNGINVTFNQQTGKVTSYSLSWYDKVTFPNIGSVLTPEKALSEFVNKNGSEINYISVGEGKASLVYDFGAGVLVDPYSGKAIDYKGEPANEETITPDYSDVTGHWSESYINMLLDNGVYLWGGKFEPNKVMTEFEFLQYIMLIEPAYYARTDPQAFFAERGIDVEASADKKLTRQEAARIVAEYLGYKKLAEQPEWFVYPFTDAVDPAYKGYITICYMLDIIGGSNGRFNASASITRAHAAVILHNLIVAQS